MDSEADRLLRQAIEARRHLEFVLYGCKRVVEPHDYGIYKGVPQLFCYQTGGQSRSKPPTGWRWAEIAKLSALRILDTTFAGPRPAPSGRHVQWDRIIASVSRR